jgi:NAD(P)-dependent dehydrogenase (short-subunit alcohol dehydrogenase family)
MPWTAENIPDQSGRIAVVTGSNSGIGFEAARMLAEKGAHVVLACRSQQKCEAALKRIADGNPSGSVELMLLDLASLEAIRAFSEAFSNHHDRLDLLVNNAGVMIPPYGRTADGFELQFGTNHLGHFALTHQLLPMLQRTEGSRIVNVASAAHNFGKLNFDDLQWEARKYKAWNAYGDSKLANLYFTYELSRRLRGADIPVKVTAAHPGYTATDLQRHSLPARIGNLFLAMPGWKGALPTLRAATDPEAQSGDYYGPKGPGEMWGYPDKVGSNKLSRDEAIAARLWEVSEEVTGERYGLAAAS